MTLELDTKLGVLGGSGIYQLDGMQVVNEHSITTPFGEPSDAIIEGLLGDKQIFFLARHGRGHRFLPSEVNYRANIYAMKKLGVTHLLAVSAVGIMQENIKPGDMVIPEQIFDRTKGLRASSFFGGGIVGHVEFADPFEANFLDQIEQAARKTSVTLHRGGTYVCIEGPQFSTRAESRHYRQSLQPSVIGMTGIPEAKLAREAELCYGMLALATDYDCWHESEDDVSVEAVLAILKANAENAKQIVSKLCEQLPVKTQSAVFEAAKYAIITDKAMISEEKKKELDLLYGKYF